MTQQATTVEPNASVRELTLSKETLRQLTTGEPGEAVGHGEDEKRCTRQCTKYCGATITCYLCSL